MPNYHNTNNNYSTYITNGYRPGTNGIPGFKTWECYMLLKYGKPNEWGLGGQYEYLIELPLYPEQVTEQITSTWSQQTVLGRSSPLSAYAQTELKSVNFNLDLHRDLLTGSFSHTEDTLLAIGGSLRNQAAGLQKESIKGPFDTRTWYTNINKMLQMSCYPQYTSSGLIPPTTYFIFGQMILKGFVSSYQTDWKKPIINTFYGWNSVSIQMYCYPDTIISADEMISGKGAQSTQNTYNTPYPGRVTASDVMSRKSLYNGANARTNARGQAASYTPGGQVADT